MILRTTLLATGFLANAACLLPAEPLTLWSEEPVVVDLKSRESPRQYFQLWERNVYPIGNGRLGATLFGDPKLEQIQFNEDSLWVGNEDNTGAYQPFGDVFVEFNHGDVSEYRRELDISRAVHTVTYRSGGVKHTRTAFASHPAQVMVFRFTAEKPGSLSGRVTMDNVHELPATAQGDTLTLTGDTSGFFFWKLQTSDPKRLFSDREYASDKNIDLDFEARVRVMHDGGSIRLDGNAIAFEKCDTLTLLVSADTNYLNRRDQGWTGPHPHERVVRWLDAAALRSYDELLAEHLADYQSLFNRLDISLGTTPAELLSLPTSARVKHYSETTGKGGVSADRGLEALVYQYARYLILASSRPGHGAMPANLQGLWLVNRRPPWRCDYHTDINLQMNYWLTGPSNLAECFLPLAEWINSIREVRKEETRKVFGSERGWLMRSENGVFGGSTWHVQKGDSAWLCQSLWDHYAFTTDKDYLKNYAYPVMREISEFWMDHLKEMPDGTLVAPKGRSPEHGPVDVDGVTYDQALCWDLFNNTIEASAILGVDQEMRKKLIDMRDRLLGPKIGRWGQLQEWMEDIDDPNEQHRHNNHLIGVHPGRQIHPETNPEWAKGAKTSLVARGKGPTGWSMIWRACIAARLLEPDLAYGHLSDVIAGKTYGNLWTTHPPFQIDCNFGYAAGVNEMIAQSHMGHVHLLPALPKAWQDGHVRGMRLRGGFELDMTWKDGKPTDVEIRNSGNPDGQCKVRLGDATQSLEILPGKSAKLPLGS